MKAAIEKNILSWGIEKKDPLVLGVSGGTDSLSLLHILYISGFNIIAVNVNHNLRPESQHEASFVKEFCKNKNIKYFGVRVDTLKSVEENKRSIEEAARNLRYRELFNIANSENAKAVCVAHNADDQVETVLMHMLRGSGLAGLRGMKSIIETSEWDSEIPLIRPMISVWRTEIEIYCELNNLSPMNDSTNSDNKFLRNKIRNELLPLLKDYNPNVKKALFQMSDILSADFDLIKDVVDEAWESSIISSSNECVEFDRDQLRECPPALQRYLFRAAIKYLRISLRDINFKTYEIILNSLASKKMGENVDLINNLALTFTKGSVYIHNSDYVFKVKHGLQLKTNEIPLIEEVEESISDSSKICLSEILNSKELYSQIKQNPDRMQAFINSEKIGNLSLRKMKEGDRFSPFGMGGHSIKLSDYFINVKIPRRERENWPLLVFGNKIIWVVGYQICDEFQVKEETKKIIKINVKSEKNEK